MLDDRESSSPRDELEELTGLRELDAAHRCHHEPAAAGFPAGAESASGGSGTAESVNGALRSLHEPGIIEAKRQAAQRVSEYLSGRRRPDRTTEADASAWVTAVNDIRLALGTMLDVGADGPHRLPAGHPMAGTSTSGGSRCCGSISSTT